MHILEYKFIIPLLSIQKYKKIRITNLSNFENTTQVWKHVANGWPGFSAGDRCSLYKEVRKETPQKMALRGVRVFRILSFFSQVLVVCSWFV